MALEIRSLGKDEKWGSLPRDPMPRYVLAQEGIFLEKTTPLGTSIIKASKMPNHLGEVGHAVGYFNWEAPRIPAALCAQIVDFFKRVYKTHKTEVEVMLTARVSTEENGLTVIDEWRVFVPTQKVSYGAVDYVYEPAHISPGHMVVGTMHSHCNFSPFHSSTDQADAARMDGVHFTIGFLDRDIPAVVGMVALSGKTVELDPEKLADFSDLKAATAPKWWDDYVVPTSGLASGHKPVGYSNFDTYKKPENIYQSQYQSSYQPHTPTSGYTNSDWARSHGVDDGWSSARRSNGFTAGGETGKDKGPNKPGDLSHLPVVTSQSLLAKKDNKVEESDDDLTIARWLLRDDTKSKKTYKTWEEAVSKEVTTALFDAEILTDDDYIMLDTNEFGDEKFLRMLLIEKTRNIKNILEMLGIKLQINATVITQETTTNNQKTVQERRQDRKEARRLRRSGVN